MQNNPHTSPSAPGVEPGYEPTHVSITGTLIFLSILLAIVLIVHFVVTKYSNHLASHAEASDNHDALGLVTPDVAASRIYFPPPHEQSNPKIDLDVFRAREDAELNSYGWVDRKSGIVRIPVARAMDLLLQQGLPTRKNDVADKSSLSNLQLQQRRAAQLNPDGEEMLK